MRMMRSVTHNGAIVAPGLGINIVVGSVVDFDQTDDVGGTVEQHLGHLASGYVPAVPLVPFDMAVAAVGVTLPDATDDLLHLVSDPEDPGEMQDEAQT